MTSTPDRPHAGHRARMRSRFYETQSAGFQEHEMLELILYCCIPKRDVNPIAHALIDRFGSLDGVLSASCEELQAVPGIGAFSSDLLARLNALNKRYMELRGSGTRTFNNVWEAVQHARQLLDRRHMSELLVLFEGCYGQLITSAIYPNRPDDSAVVRGVIGTALSANAHSAVLLANTFLPLRAPGEHELRSLMRLIESLNGIDVGVPDCILLSGSHVFSLREQDRLPESPPASRFYLPGWGAWLEPLQLKSSAPGWYRLDKEPGDTPFTLRPAGK